MKLQPTTGPEDRPHRLGVLVVAGQQQRDHARAADECREGYGAHARGGHAPILACAGAARQASPRARPGGAGRRRAHSVTAALPRRTWLHDMPSAASAGRPSPTAVRTSTRLQDDPVGERVAARHAEAGQDRDARRLEDADVGRRDRDHGGHVDGHEDRRGAGQAGRGLQVERLQHEVGGQHLQGPRGELGERRGDAVAQVTEDAQPTAHPLELERHPRQRAAQARRPVAAGAAQRAGRDQHEPDQRERGAEREQRPDGRAERPGRRDHRRAERHERDEVQHRLREDRAGDDRDRSDPPRDDDRPRRLTQPTGEDRRDHHADHRRPHHHRRGHLGAGQRRPEHHQPRHGPQEQRQHHQRRGEGQPSEVHADQCVDDVVQPQATDRDGGQPEPDERGEHRWQRDSASPGRDGHHRILSRIGRRQARTPPDLVRASLDETNAVTAGR